MTTTQRLPEPVAPEPVAHDPTDRPDGLARTRAVLGELRGTGLALLLALPGWLVYVLLAGLGALLVLLAAGEYAQLYATVSALLRELHPTLRHLLTSGLMVAYLGIWHGVGSRAYLVRSVTLRMRGNRGRPRRRAFGVWGTFSLVAGTTILFVVAFSRAHILALDAADRAADRAERAVTFGAAPDPAMVEAVRAEAYDQFYWPDLRWSIASLALLAAGSLLVGMVGAPLKQAAAVAAIRAALRRKRRKAGKLQAAEAMAHLELASRVRARERAASLAAMHERELPQRFEAGRVHGRLRIAEGMGHPNATDQLGHEDGAHPAGP